MVSYREPEDEQRQADIVTEAGARGRSGALLPASPARGALRNFEALRNCFMGRVSPPPPQLRREL